MSEPIAFKLKRPTHVFECACGCQLFYLNADKSVECRVCGHSSINIRWYDTTEPAQPPAELSRTKEQTK